MVDSHRQPFRLRCLVAAGACAGMLLAGVSCLHAEVGVTAAVNVDARGRQPGAAPRVLTLGARVVFNEEITTDANGLVQVLLLDGTTFTVGPNSQLTIDEFVYDPGTGDAKVVASLTRGVFRFVGARTSQTEGGATIRTPVGTIGIRGAVTNISYDPSSGETTAALVAGKSLNITDSDGTTRIVYETGYTAVITREPGGATRTTVRKSTAAETRVFQQQLAGKAGQTGGSSSQPTDTTVAGSGIGDTNSGLPDSMVVPGSPKPVQSSDPEQVDQVAGIGGKSQDDLDDEIEQEETQPNARLLTAPPVYQAFFGESFAAAGGRGLVGSTPETDQVLTLLRQGGRLVSSTAQVDLPDFAGTQGDSGLESIAVPSGNATYQGNPLSGTAYAGRGDFVVYFLDMDDANPAQDRPFYVLYGAPTDEPALISLDTGFDVREYTLTPDPIRNVPVPFFSNDLYAGAFAAGTYNSSDLLVIEPGFSETADVRAFQSWVSIEGTGGAQKSAAFIFTGNVYFDEANNLVMDGGRRGSFRYSADDGATNLRGGIRTLPGASGGHLFGPNAEHFVIGTSIDPADTFFDSHNGPGFTGDGADGYLGDGNFATHHVGDLVAETATEVRTRSSRELAGYMAGMGESNYDGPGQPYRLHSGNAGPNLVVGFNAVDNAFAAQATVHDAADDNDGLLNLLLTFGHFGEDTGQSAYVDDTYFGAKNNDNPENTRLRTDDDGDIAHVPDYGAGSYIVSGRANPIAGYDLLEGCETCAFIQWGWWGTRVETADGEEPRRDYVHMGTWAAGELTDASGLQSTDVGVLPFGGTAFYEGTALGSVNNDGEQYIASGSVGMVYHFSERYGEFEMQFDGHGLEGSVYDDVYEPTGNFSGNLVGGSATGFVSGSFIDDSTLPDPRAAGAIGNFSLSGTNYQAVGTFATIGNSPL